MTKILYTLTIHFYKSAIFILSLVNKKAKLRIEGILNSDSILIDLNKNCSAKKIFIHCASQGEYEQALPIIRWVLNNTKFHIVLSFYSPSGFFNVHNNNTPRITKIFFPFDTPNQMSKFVQNIKPQIAIIIKNEWWWNLIYELKKHNIPAYLVSATFRKQHYFIQYKNQFFTNGINTFSKIFVVDQDSKDIISEIAETQILVSGDTRKDQVNHIKSNNQFDQSKPHYLENNNNKEVVVYGSIWESDVESINELITLYPDAIHLIYPHELDQLTIRKLNSQIPNSELKKNTNSITSKISIITTMGELKLAYSLASVAYVGGGFGEGIHNILEASVYGIPTLLGPNHLKSNEAIYLLSTKCAFTFSTPNELKTIRYQIEEENFRKEIESKLKSYFSPDFSPSIMICKEIFLKNDTDV